LAGRATRALERLGAVFARRSAGGPAEQTGTGAPPGGPAPAGSPPAGGAAGGNTFRRKHWLVFAALFSIFSYYYWTQEIQDCSVAAIKAHGDGIYYYSYLRSLVFDRDLDFTNDYRLLGDPFELERDRTRKNRPKNPFAPGSALLWLPWLGGAHLVIGGGRLLGLWDDPLDGTSVRYQRVVFYGTLIWGMVALILIALAARRYSDPGVATLTAAGLALATPLCWYMVRQASLSHALDALAVAALVYWWLRDLYRRRLWHWAVLGALGGLVTLVRTQGFGHAVLPLGEWLVLLAIALRRRDSPELGRLALAGLVCGVTAALVLLPQAAAWHAIYDKWLLIPQGKSFMLWGNSKWIETLYSSRNGLLAFSPLLQLGLAGLVLMVVRPRGPHARTVGALALIAIAVQAYLNGAAQDWWAGWAFGGRRFVGCTVYFGLGLASLISTAGPLLVRAGRALAPALPALVLAVFALFNLSLMDDYLEGRAARASEQSMGKLWRGAIDGAFEKVYKITGNPGSFPANIAFGIRAGVSPARYDRTSGTELLYDESAATVDLTDERFAMGGFGEPTRNDGRACRWVEGRKATIVLPLRKAKGLTASLLLKPAWPETRVRLRIGRRTVFNEVLEPKWKSYDFAIPRRSLTAGLNYLSIEQELPSPRRWAIGRTGTSSRQEVQVESAGYSAGNRAAFYFGREKASSWRRGVIVYVFDREGTSFARLGIFDTFRIPEETAAFAGMIRHLPEGTGVALAVKDEASTQWTSEGDQALRSLGARVSLLGRFRHSYALIGVKGARPGEAIEAVDAQRPVTAVLGRPLAERGYGVAWSALGIRIE
jgi:hypothetical protein